MIATNETICIKKDNDLIIFRSKSFSVNTIDLYHTLFPFSFGPLKGEKPCLGPICKETWTILVDGTRINDHNFDPISLNAIHNLFV
jgi:hypothetical protein